MLLSIEEKDKVVGEIYKITNIKTNKSYIGQTRSHRLNHNKYRPFGYLDLKTIFMKQIQIRKIKVNI
jgi:hypothetical protein